MKARLPAVALALLCLPLAACVAPAAVEPTPALSPIAVATRPPLPTRIAPTAGPPTPTPTPQPSSPEAAALLAKAQAKYKDAPLDPYFTRRPVPLPQPVAPRPLKPLPELERGLRDILGADAPLYGVVVKDIADGRGVEINPQRAFYAASLFKMGVMFEVFHERSLNQVRFDELLEVTQRYLDLDLLHRLPLKVGDRLTVDQLLRYMMAVSDNVSANMLMDRVSAANVNRAFAALGLTETVILPDGDIPTSAGDMALLLETLARSDRIDDQSRREMLELLVTETFDNGLKPGIPREVTVAHKTGNWSNATHEAGIVFGPKSIYVITILAEKDHDARLTQQISRYVYEYLNKG